MTETFELFGRRVTVNRGEPATVAGSGARRSHEIALRRHERDPGPRAGIEVDARRDDDHGVRRPRRATLEQGLDPTVDPGKRPRPEGEHDVAGPLEAGPGLARRRVEEKVRPVHRSGARDPDSAHAWVQREARGRSVESP